MFPSFSFTTKSFSLTEDRLTDRVDGEFTGTLTVLRTDGCLEDICAIEYINDVIDKRDMNWIEDGDPLIGLEDIEIDGFKAIPYARQNLKSLEQDVYWRFWIVARFSAVQTDSDRSPYNEAQFAGYYRY